MKDPKSSHRRTPEEMERMRDMAAYLQDLANAIPEQASMLWRMAKNIEKELDHLDEQKKNEK